MGIVKTILVSIPTSAIMYLLVNKIIMQFISHCNYDNMQQKSFILEFICGLVLLVLAIFTKSTIKYALFITGGFMVVNAGILNWDGLDEYTKIIFLFILFILCVTYSYKNI
jgi:hypothetical protein